MSDEPVFRFSPEFVEACRQFNAAYVAAMIEIGRRCEPLVEAYRNDMRRLNERLRDLSEQR